LAAIPGVEITHSRFGSGANRAWRVGKREFAHLHSTTLIDLRLPRAMQATLRSDPRAHFRAGRSEWLEIEFHSAQDVAMIAALAREAAIAAQGKGR
jgi:hypothetical protein